jgi:O-antigen/teichoic acid export membrane protein
MALTETTAPEQPDANESSATSGKALLGGGAVLAISMTIANGGNYALNLLLGRWMTPAAFADANLMVTLMLLVTAVAVALQLIAARFTSIHEARNTPHKADEIASWLEDRAALIGLGFAAFIGLPAVFWASAFNTESWVPFAVLGAGMPFYIVQAVGRGVLQGRLKFNSLAITFVIEMVVRVGVAIALVQLGFGVTGATVGLTASFVATWLAVRMLTPRSAAGRPDRSELGDLITYAGPVVVLLVGQIIINNGDVLVVKRFFDPTEAGIYAAVALIGRAVFFLSWSAVTALFPAVAQRDEAGEASGGLLLGGLAVVGGLCSFMVLMAWIVGDRVFTFALGDAYAGVGHLLVQYAIATSLFTMANLIVSHHLSTGRVLEAWILLAGGVLQTTLLLIWNSTPEVVVVDQLIAMAILLVAVAASTVLVKHTPSSHSAPTLERVEA